MKKIAFFVQWLLCGGVENALINLTEELVKRGNDVTIYVIKNKGDFVEKVPETIGFKEIPMDSKVRKQIPVGGTTVTVRDCISEKKYLTAIKFVMKHKLHHTEFAELNIALEDVPTLEEKFDIAVNFHMHSPFLVWYLSERVLANTKYTWIHNDFETTQYNIIKLEKYLECIDGFFCVGQNLADEFIERFPKYRKITEVAHNLIPIKEILIRAEEFYPKEFSGTKKIKLLTVGRLEEQKGYDIALDVCERLKKNNIKFEWFILGNGTQRYLIEEEIKKRKISGYFHLLGAKMNPYPYFKNCDIYVQTSRHEGYVTTVTEAKIFNCPIVTTNVSGAKEQLIDGVNGEIADITVDSVYERLFKLIQSEDIRIRYASELEKNKTIENETWLSKF